MSRYEVSCSGKRSDGHVHFQSMAFEELGKCGFIRLQRLTDMAIRIIAYSRHVNGALFRHSKRGHMFWPKKVLRSMAQTGAESATANPRNSPALAYPRACYASNSVTLQLH